VLEVYVVILDVGAGIVDAMVTCASLALADARVELFDLLPAVGAVRVPAGGARAGPR
jgi:ribonuclease PH